MDMEQRIAIKIFNEKCIGKTDRYHGGNCVYCCLRGIGKPNTADEKEKEPNYSGWARLYVQAGKIIPEKFKEAFYNQLNSDNKLYAEALQEDIKKYGLKVK